MQNGVSHIIESLATFPSNALPWIAVILLIVVLISIIIAVVKLSQGNGILSLLTKRGVSNESIMLKLNTISENHLHELPEVVESLRRQESLLIVANEKLTAIDKGVAVLNTKLDAIR